MVNNRILEMGSEETQVKRLSPRKVLRKALRCRTIRVAYPFTMQSQAAARFFNGVSSEVKASLGLHPKKNARTGQNEYFVFPMGWKRGFFGDGGEARIVLGVNPSTNTLTSKESYMETLSFFASNQDALLSNILAKLSDELFGGDIIKALDGLQNGLEFKRVSLLGASDGYNSMAFEFLYSDGNDAPQRIKVLTNGVNVIGVTKVGKRN